MALVKTSSSKNGISPRETGNVIELVDTDNAAKNQRESDALRRKARTLAKQQQAAERIASASNELESSITEAATASEELRRSMDQISKGAEEASGASQESLQAFGMIMAAINKQQSNANISLEKTETLQALTADLRTEITNTINNVGIASERQMASLQLMGELEKQASNIGEIVQAVGRIADQTNLLALNAAIEAARAGKHGKGFAVVADEVRTLAETSERSAKQIQDLVKQIQSEVQVISDGINKSAQAAKEEVAKGTVITGQLEQARLDMIQIKNGAMEISRMSEESSTAARQAEKSSEIIAAAAAEQASACQESLQMVDQQSKALSMAEQSSQELSALADELRTSTNISKSAEEVAATAEDLTSATQEMTQSARQIVSALEQISTGAKQQSSAAEESSAAVTQIEKGAAVADEKAKAAYEKGMAMVTLLGESRTNVDALIQGVSSSLEENRKSRDQMTELGLVSRRIDKIVDAITTVSTKTGMLAVNGAIEAARAGEFGKGFVVVATDIRNLAQDSAENAEQIKDVVKAVQDQIAIVTRDLEEISATAASEMEKTRSITVNLGRLEQDMNTVVEGNTEIAESAAEIGTALLQLKNGIDQIASAATQAEQASVQASTASHEQLQVCETLEAAIEEISSLADELQSA